MAHTECGFNITRSIVNVEKGRRRRESEEGGNGDVLLTAERERERKLEELPACLLRRALILTKV